MSSMTVPYFWISFACACQWGVVTSVCSAELSSIATAIVCTSSFLLRLFRCAAGAVCLGGHLDPRAVHKARRVAGPVEL